MFIYYYLFIYLLLYYFIYICVKIIRQILCQMFFIFLDLDKLHPNIMIVEFKLKLEPCDLAYI